MLRRAHFYPAREEFLVWWREEEEAVINFFGGALARSLLAVKTCSFDIWNIFHFYVTNVCILLLVIQHNRSRSLTMLLFALPLIPNLLCGSVLMKSQILLCGAFLFRSCTQFDKTKTALYGVLCHDGDK